MDTYGLPVVVTNCSNNYGPYQFPEKVIPLFVTNLIDGGTVPLYGEGTNVRDWLHVDDHCRGIALALLLTCGAAAELRAAMAAPPQALPNALATAPVHSKASANAVLPVAVGPAMAKPAHCGCSSIGGAWFTMPLHQSPSGQRQHRAPKSHTMRQDRKSVV